MKEKPAADANLKKLLDGNKRYVNEKAKHPHQSSRRRKEVSKGQKPFAIVVGCSDSRIPPEIVFDQGLGDLFIVRVAGNIVDNVALGSIEYAVDHLGVELVVVLGHGACGAVTAASKGSKAPGHIGCIMEAIAPALKTVKGKEGDFVDNAIKANVDIVVSRIATTDPILSKSVKKGTLKVVGTYYNIESGVVEVL